MRPPTTVTRLLTSIAAITSMHVTTWAADLDQSDKDYLESAWLIGQAPDRGLCGVKPQNPTDRSWWDKTSIEFEFKRTGGRFLIYDPPDIFNLVNSVSVSKAGDTIRFGVTSVDGGITSILIKPRPPDRIALQFPHREPNGQITYAKETVAYRCAPSNPAVNAKVSDEWLRFLAPAHLGETRFVEADPAIPDTKRCASPKWTMLEFIGPAHFFTFGSSKISGSELNFVRKVEQTAPDTLDVTLEAFDPSHRGWNFANGSGQQDHIKIVRQGDQIRIPELNKVFTRCP